MKTHAISQRNIRVFYVSQFFRSLVFTIAITIVFFQRIIGPVEISLLYAYRYFVQMVSELPTGAVADMLGKRLSIVIGYCFLTFAVALLPLVRNFMHILIFYGTLLPIGDSFLSGAVEAILYDSLKQDGREKEFMKIRANENVIFQTGLIIASICSGFLYTLNLWFPYLLEAGTTAMAIVSSLFFIEPLIDTEKFTLKSYIRQIKQGSKEVFKTEHLKKVSLFYVLIGAITWSTVLFFNKYLLVDLGFSDQARGVVDGSLRFINVVVLTKILLNKNLFTKKRAILFFPLILAISYLPGVLFQKWLALPFIAGAMMVSTARFVVLGQLVNDEFESKYRATANSVLSMLIGFVYVMLTLASGPIIANFGGVRMVYTLLGILSLVTVLPLAISIVREEK